MKILMLSFEYPPSSAEDTSDYVYDLSKGLSDLGHEINLVTVENGTCPIKEEGNGVFVSRVKASFPFTEDFTKWVMQVNFFMIEECIRIIDRVGKIDLIHAHDWHTAFAARTIKWSYNIPLVCNMYSTEFGRNSEIITDAQRFISSTEWSLSYEAKKIITSSKASKNQIKDIYSIPEEKICFVNYGINLDKKISREVDQVYKEIFV